MAKPKGSKSSKPAKKSAPKKPAAKKKVAAVKDTKKAAARRAAPKAKVEQPALSADQKKRLLKPLSNFDDLIERLASTWKEHGRAIRVPGLTAGKLASLLRTAKAANKKEDALRARLEARLRPLADARLRAEHEAWKAALDVYAMIKAAARTDPAILGPFEFFADALQRRRAGAEAPADADGGPT